MAYVLKWAQTAVKTANYTASLGQTVRCNPTGGGFTVTLPSVAAGDAGRQVKVKNQTGSTNNITVAGQGGTTVDGAANVVMNLARQCLTFEYDGVSDWMVT